MIRTTLSLCALFGSLILVSKLLQESSRPSATPAPALIAPEDDGCNESVPVESARLPKTLRSAQRVTLPAISPLETLCGQEYFVNPTLLARSQSDSPHSPVRPVLFEEPSEAGAESTADPLLEILAEPKSEKPVEPVNNDASEAADDVPPAEKTPVEPAATKDDGKDENKESAVEPAKLALELTPELLDLRASLREALAHYYHRPESVAIRSPWGAMHAMIAYGVDTELIAGDRRVNAIGYLCYNGTCNGQQLFHTNNKKLAARIGVGVQGHAGQFLAMLAQSRVKTDFPMKADGMDFTVADLIQHEKDTCRPRTELTFKLISLVHYLKSDEKWKSNDGQDWDIPRLIQEELKQPIIGAACGGTHRMTGFSYAVRKREQRKEEFTGQWLRAKKFVDSYHEYTFRLQNPDGSFSTDWFAGRADFGPPSRRLETTGHITEWLAFSLSPQELRDPKMVKSVTYLTNLLLDGRNEKWSIGPLGHGLHALAIYDERVFGGKPGQRGLELAREPGKTQGK